MIWLLIFLAIMALGHIVCLADALAPEEPDPYRLDKFRAGDAADEND